jgi:hypothetical protein
MQLPLGLLSSPCITFVKNVLSSSRLLHCLLWCRHGQLVMLGKGNNLPLDKVLYVVQSGIVKVCMPHQTPTLHVMSVRTGCCMPPHCPITRHVCLARALMHTHVGDWQHMHVCGLW